MNKKLRLSNFFRSKKAKEEIEKQLKDVTTDFEDIIDEHAFIKFASMVLVIVSSLVLLVLVLVDMNPHISNDFLRLSAFILFMINVISVWISWDSDKK